MKGAILITGAGRGIGRALALHFATGGVTLLLAARTADGLADTAAECRRRGAAVVTHHFDIANRDALRAWLVEVDEAHPVDCVILNAGMSDGRAEGELLENAVKTRRQVEVNLLAPIEAVDILAPRMAARGGGRIALMSSLAAWAPLPGSSGYCVSKAGLRMYASCVRPLLKQSGIALTLIMPGFVRTDMSSRMEGWQPFRMSVEKAAAIMAAGIEKKKAQVVFPLRLAVMCRALDMMSPSVMDFVLRRASRYRVRAEQGHEG